MAVPDECSYNRYGIWLVRKRFAIEMTAGIRDLKKNLGHYLREVKKGRSVTVTERGNVVATIVPGRTNAGESVMFSCLMLASPMQQESSSAVYEIGKSSEESGALSA